MPLHPFWKHAPPPPEIDFYSWEFAFVFDFVRFFSRYLSLTPLPPSHTRLRRVFFLRFPSILQRVQDLYRIRILKTGIFCRFGSPLGRVLRI